MIFQRTFIHVLPTRNQWEVKARGEEETESFYPTEAEAVRNAETLARVALPSEVMVHNSDGTIVKHESYE